MRCLEPMSIQKPGQGNKYNRITVPCGKCAACYQNKQNNWVTRLELQLKYSSNCYFVTLTYEEMPEDLSISKRELQLFFKRLRKNYKLEKLKYFAVGEYGENFQRPHYHLLLFNFIKDQFKAHDAIFETWNNGFIHMGTITTASIKYATKYCLKLNEIYPPNVEKPFQLISNGLGFEYLKKHGEWHQSEDYRDFIPFPGNIKVAMPRYFKEKLYNKETLEHIAERNRIINDIKDQKDREDFERSNPGQSYFQLVIDRKEDIVRRSTKKSKINNKL